jgi:hypothetical protein
MKTSEKTVEFNKAFLEFQRVVKGIKKDGQGYGYQYITLDQILELVRPSLSQFSLILNQDVGSVISSTGEVLTTVSTRLTHAPSGEYVETGDLIMKPTNIAKDGSMKPVTPQHSGSSITYAKRYQLTGLLGLSADVDDDAAAVSANAQEWGNKVSPAQLQLLGQLMAKTGITKDTINPIMIQEIQCVKKSTELSGDEADKIIKHLNAMALGNGNAVGAGQQ